MVELSFGGAVTFTRLIQLMKAGGAEYGALVVAAEGGGVMALRFAAAGRSVVLTEMEIAALVNAGILSAASWNLMMMASGKGKRVDSKRFKEWEDSQPRRPAPRGDPANEYQVRQCGETETQVQAESGTKIWADGTRAEEAMLLEAKHAGSVERSPYLPGSKFPEKLRAKVQLEQLEQLEKLKRYAAVVRDPSTPAVGVEIITNEPGAVGYFEKLMQEAGVPGRVVLKP
jgi:hypothetical protein